MHVTHRGSGPPLIPHHPTRYRRTNQTTNLGHAHCGGGVWQWAPTRIPDSHAAGQPAHRRQRRQCAEPFRHRLVSDTASAGAEQPFGPRPVGGEVEVGEQHPATPEAGDLRRRRLLHFDDRFAGVEHRAGGLGAGRAVGVVAR
jgi:hypothetical protein